ncbi:hypothetical protein HYH03_012686 [Edaphochlamys debaryana]|uniref:Photosystem I reaction center subunit II, chloroplastic n=1 Tax=Edaphochlamys debaryana TaxID=47281 RepID=A0A835XS55_9CHLO|nr:hypothetical protein HYH03_012686 [Edaphochlamys debaryana]|eukprot:KAG2488685.1 hypothetical protein HYH03_012686 [Edaphochlamys debaryana]
MAVAMRTQAPTATRATASRMVAARPARRVVSVRAEQAAAPAKPAAEKPAWTAPTLNPDTPSPIFGGSTGGILRNAQLEEFYVITWEAKKEQIFEMPTGGAAIMRAGPNLLKFGKKEQCLALTTQLRTKFKLTPAFYRVFPDGKVEYLHPADGVYPEKVNAGRVGVNQNMRRIGQNVNPIKVKFAGRMMSPAEI